MYILMLYLMSVFFYMVLPFYRKEPLVVEGFINKSDVINTLIRYTLIHTPCIAYVTAFRRLMDVTP